MKSNIYLRKVEKAAELSFKNSIRLLDDSILLFNSNRISSALLLVILSIEEIAKYFMYENSYYHNCINEDPTPESIVFWFKESHNHKLKQSIFINRFSEITNSRIYMDEDRLLITKSITKIYDLVIEKQLDKLKQDSTYVGFEKNKSKYNLDGKLNSPLKSSKKITKDLITIINDFIIILSLGVRKGWLYFDIENVNNLLRDPDIELTRKSVWLSNKKESIPTIRRLLKHEDIGPNE